MEINVFKKTNVNDWLEKIDQSGPDLMENELRDEASDSFVSENYSFLKHAGFLNVLIPNELGGEGLLYSEMCQILKKLATYSPSTALALSMHQHLVAANLWKYLNNKGGDELLKKVASNNLILISTGARDWLESTGEMTKTEGGYLVSGEKHFASQSAIGDVLVTSAPYNHPDKGWLVLHFGIPMNSKGITVRDNWYALGMRGTGSQTVHLENVFIPESGIALERVKGEYHSFWNVVLTVALPLIMSVYVGIAEKSAQLALAQVRKREMGPHIPFIVGELNNHLTSVKVLYNDMVALCNNMAFTPDDALGVAMLTRKTLISEGSKAVVNKALEAVGGYGFYRINQLEKLFRDVQASNFHPLPIKQQLHFTGEFLLKQTVK